MNLFINQLQNDKYLCKEKATKVSLTVSTIEVLEAQYSILCCTFYGMIHYVGSSPPLHTPYISTIIIQKELLKLPLSVKLFLFSIQEVRKKIFQGILN